MAGPRKEFEVDLNTSCYALQDCCYVTFRFDTLALNYFNFENHIAGQHGSSRCQTEMLHKSNLVKHNEMDSNLPQTPF